MFRIRIFSLNIAVFPWYKKSIATQLWCCSSFCPQFYLKEKKMVRTILLFLLFFALAPQISYAVINEVTSTLDDRKDVAVTIYNNNLALIKDKRIITLKKGVNSVAVREVSALLRPETALLRSLSGQGLSVMEQNFDFDLLTPQKLMEEYVGRRVSVVRVHPTTGEETMESAQVLSANQGIVLKIGDRIETGFPGRVVFPDVPESLRDRPTLTLLVESDVDEPRMVELSYLSGGLSWKADYVLELSADDSLFDIGGWVTLTNTSGTSYGNARLQLVAGEVGQVTRAARPRFKGDMVLEAKAAGMKEEPMFEYHLYSMERPTTILDNQTKQVSLLHAGGIECAKEFLLQGNEYYYKGRHGDLGTRLRVGVYLEFLNTRKNHLGMPLPKGIMRVYKKDSRGNALFVGEDTIDHTPENDTVRLKLGEAFDITADKKQTDFRKLAGAGRFDYVFESAYQIDLNNAKDEEVVVKVAEPMPGDWQILQESHPSMKATSSTAVWYISLPAKGKTVLNWRVRVRY